MVSIYEEEIRKELGKRMNANWNYSLFFLLKVK
jgi:hypothetical protein